MRIRRTFPVVLSVLAIVGALIFAVQLRKHAPPEAARLLPGADAFFYVNLNPVRKATSDKELPRVSHDAEYERFIHETGFEFERDLDEAAFAVHYPASWPGGGTGGSAPEPRFSEVLVGKFQSEKLTAYLRQIAQSIEHYQSVDIFSIQLQGRSLRVAVLSADSVAVSNHDDPAVIRGMIDRSRRLASPFGGPALLRQYYKHVQLASLAWSVARVDPHARGFGSWGALFGAPATVVASGTYLSPLHLNLMANAIHLRVEAFTQSAEEARNIIDKVNVFVALTHTAETSAGVHGTDPDVKSFFESLQVKQDEDRAVLNASVPYGFLRKMLADSNPELTEPAASPATAPTPAATPTKSR
jgi:hypothetical protein